MAIRAGDKTHEAVCMANYLTDAMTRKHYHSLLPREAELAWAELEILTRAVKFRLRG